MTLLPTTHRRIPILPARPRVHPIDDHICRSYPVGRQNVSRACQGDKLMLTLTTVSPIPDPVQVNLVTTLNSALNSEDGNVWTEVPFVRVDPCTLVCCITPRFPGLHSFRAEFSLDGGATWLRDTVPDAWVLIDPPQVDGLRIYTLIPTVSGTIADWTADLKRIRDMGFNAIHLLPITALDTSESPYSARDLFAIDRSYMTPGAAERSQVERSQAERSQEEAREEGLAQLEGYVAAAKALNIRLCFDLVLNHVGVHSDMASRAPDWIVPDRYQPDGLQRARYWSDQGWRAWDDLVLINYEHPSDSIRAEIWAYMIDYALFWAKYASDTGGFVRFDNLHSSNRDFVQVLTATLHKTYPEVGVIAEYFTDEHMLLTTGPQWGLNLVLATPWGYKFVPQLRDYLNYLHRVSEDIRYYIPITSHDSGAPAQEFGTAESTVPRYVAAALLGTGATGMPQGVEFGELERIDFIGRKPKMEYPAEPRFAPFIAQVNAILAAHPAFRRGKNCQFVDNGHPAVIAAFRQDTGPEALGFLVVCNFDINGSQSISIDLAPLLGNDGPFHCHELLSRTTQTVPHPRLELVLPPCGAQVLKFFAM